MVTDSTIEEVELVIMVLLAVIAPLGTANAYNASPIKIAETEQQVQHRVCKLDLCFN